MNPQCAIIVNPTSGGYSDQALRRLVTALSDRGFSPAVLPTLSPFDAEAHARDWCRGKSDPLVIAAGGDGTVNGVVNGLHPGEARLAVVPLGTSNVLARELGIVSIEDAV